MRLRLNVLGSFNHTLLIRLNDLKPNHYEEKDLYTVLMCDNQVVAYQIPNYDRNLNGKIEVTSQRINEINTKYKLNLKHDEYSYIVVGKVIEIQKHPHSEHLKICKVDIGSTILQIVCGASNVTLNMMCVVALENAIIQDEIIKNGTLLKIESQGMLCSAYELGIIKEKQKGLLQLDNSYVVGEEFKWKG